MRLRLLHLEDNGDDVELVRATLARDGFDCDILAVDSGAAYLAALQQSHFDAVLSDSSVLDYDGSEALSAARERFPGIPFIVVSAAAEAAGPREGAVEDAATARVPKSELQRLGPAIRHALSRRRRAPATAFPRSRAAQGMPQLISVIQRLSLEACISGWSMLNRQAAAIEDIYLDARIPHDAYRPKFVKSLVMTPIRTVAPIGAIGVYWANQHRATPQETELLQALAESTSIAIEAAELFANLERKVAERTAEVARRNSELEVLNKELEAFSYSVAHDLRSPLITIDGFAQVLLENTAGSLDEPNRQHLERITTAVRRMHRLINDLLGLSKIVRAPLHCDTVDLSRVAREILQTLRDSAPTRVADFVLTDGIVVPGDPGLLRVALENLLSNAWKFTARQERTRIEFGTGTDQAGRVIYFVRDNGAGFDPKYAAKLFSPFQRLHSATQFAGSGIGLATVQRIIHRHGGEIWAESAVNCGAGFYFTLGR
jgi:signal transduction histidine kinase